ncbi:hypothetical protein DPMN_104039, partial [Dreissena polymorpha]
QLKQMFLEYAHDEVFVDADCNRCRCDDGRTVCEMNADGRPEEESCINDGKEYAHDEVFLDADCNRCRCDDGTTICEMNAEGCPEVCEYNNNWYEAGDSFPDDVGCNTCTCLRGGLVACYRMSCSGTTTPDYVK